MRERDFAFPLTEQVWNRFHASWADISIAPGEQECITSPWGGRDVQGRVFGVAAFVIP